jgi:mono/diheme cytochrome c family protein
MYAVGALMVGCTAHQRPSQIETRLANAAKDLVIPLEAEKLKNPLPVSDQVIQQGEEIYMEDCGICHASDGHSRTNLGRNMYPPAMDLTSPHVQHWSDAELFWIVQNGVRLTGMPSWKSTISETDTWKLVRFVKAIPGRDAARRTQATSSPPAPKSEAELIVYGRTLYRQEGCFTCHQLNGEGAKFGPDLTVEGTRGRQREWLLGHFKNPQAYTPGSMMPAFTNLTDEQLEALATFLEHQTGEKH